jgi:hypothetical protein
LFFIFFFLCCEADTSKLQGMTTPQLLPNHQSNLLTQPPTPAAENKKSVASWTPKEVVGWLHRNGLQHLSRW